MSLSIVVNQSILSTSTILVAPAAIPTTIPKTTVIAAFAFASVGHIFRFILRTVATIGAAIRPAPQA
ncbi:hypothetical protein C8F04DRAFT_1273013 [Mycena alexandri]|uniref:Uncharacterized protein n=1 Tax=Mycena alexandri TaxID=1745969 RepID=A0AAD6WUY4_9AGAR|nr:hypothetical protein C8F04DRAFT_1273013 [Mycena alexandri]